MVLGDFPCLPPQSGDAKDAVRKEVRALFDQICCFYAPPKLFGYVAEGLKSKNSRQRFGEKLESRHEEYDGWLGDVCTIVQFSVTLSSSFSLCTRTYVHTYLSQLSLSPFLPLSSPLPPLLSSPVSSLASLLPPSSLSTHLSLSCSAYVECLEMLGVLVQNNGLVVCQPSPQKAVQQIAPFVGEKDSSVPNPALNTLVIYENMGEAVYKHVGRVSS